ncbi:MAG: M23 family metallopeptidase [bacterium]|nr:M23 family metallopeptidase [bacterium]
MKNKLKKINFFSKRVQTLFTFVLLSFSLFSFYAITYFDFGFSYSIKNIITSWSPNENIGKLKFVDNINGGASEVLSSFSVDYCLPFENAELCQGDNGSIVVSGNGDVIVRACYDAIVSLVNDSDLKRNITFDCSYSIKIVYSGLDNVGVKVNQQVKKGEEVGISNSSLITVTILYNDLVYDKIKVENGKLSLF